MKFYDCQTAPSPRRVRIFIAEKGLDIPVVEIDLRNGEHLTEAYKKINPWCTVPALELDDGTVISEITACWRYLEEIQSDPPLLGVDSKDKALVEMWNRRMEFDGFYAVAEALRNSAKGMKDRALTGPVNVAQIPELAERGRARTERFLLTLNDILSDRQYVVGDRFSAADITAMVTVDFAAWVKIRPTDDLTNLNRWYTEVAARPASKL